MLVKLAAVALVALVRGADSIFSRDLDDMLHMLKDWRRLKEPQSLLPFFVNPFSPMLLCDWHYSNDEPDTWKGDLTWTQIATNPLNKSGAVDVKPCESVCVDVATFESFVTDILPSIKVKMLLFTHRWTLPQLHKSHITEVVRTHPNISHWFAQNPVYVEDDKYSAFPYGLEPVSLHEFADAFLSYHQGYKLKDSTIEHLHVSDTHPSRQKLISKRAAREGHLHVRQYYEKIAGTRFMISPRGDRPDCYRHWEAIGLGAIPIANIDWALYGPLFGNDMMYVDDVDEMIELLDNLNRLDSRYQPPQSHKVLTRYWMRKVGDARRRCDEGV